jgi:hypothetical protein
MMLSKNQVKQTKKIPFLLTYSPLIKQTRMLRKVILLKTFSIGLNSKTQKMMVLSKIPLENITPESMK